MTRSLISVLAIASATPVAFAQDPYDELTSRKLPVSATDENGINLVTGKFNYPVELINSPEAAGFPSLVLNVSGPPDHGDFSTLEEAFAVVFWEGISGKWSGSAFVSAEYGTIASQPSPAGVGMFLHHSANDVVNPDGSRVSRSLGPGFGALFKKAGQPNVYVDADGSRMDLPFTTGATTAIRLKAANGEITDSVLTGERLDKTYSNRGFVYQIKYKTGGSVHYQAAPDKAFLFNRATAFCNPSTAICNELDALAQVSFQYDAAASEVKILKNGEIDGIVVKLQKFGSKFKPWVQSIRHTAVSGSQVSYTTSIASDGYSYIEPFVSAFQKGGQTWAYTHFREMYEGGIGAQGYVTRTGPDGKTISGRGFLVFGIPDLIEDQIARQHVIEVDPMAGRILGYAYPGGAKVTLTRDNRNNILTATRVPKPGSGETPIVSSAVYPTHCENPTICNRPTSMTDGRGNVTEFTYDPTHGGVLTETSPPDANGVRAVKRRSYAQHFAWVKSAGSGYEQMSDPIWLLAEERTCRTTATVGNACSGGVADEVVTTFQYQNGGATMPSNLLLIGVAITADGQTLRTCYGYDQRGRRISETKPRAALATCQQ